MALSAVDALAMEAAGELGPPVFEFGGETFPLPARLDLRAAAALQRGDFARALDLLLGKDQAARLVALDTDEAFDEAAIARLFDVFATSQGTSRGESSASSGS